MNFKCGSRSPSANIWTCVFDNKYCKLYLWFFLYRSLMVVLPVKICVQITTNLTFKLESFLESYWVYRFNSLTENKDNARREEKLDLIVPFDSKCLCLIMMIYFKELWLPINKRKRTKQLRHYNDPSLIQRSACLATIKHWLPTKNNDHLR